MKLRWMACALFLLATAPPALFAQTFQGQQPVAQDAGAYPLDGIVVNAVTGEPIRNALVSISQGGARSSLLTGPEGKFHFDVLGAGQLDINVQKPGFFSEAQLREIAEHADRITTVVGQRVEVGPSAAPVVLKLVPEGVIFGQITDARGRPAERVPVNVFYAVIIDGKKNWRQQRGMQTDSNGQYRIFDLRPGAYYLSAGHFTSTFYSGVRDVDSASLINIAPGRQVQADFQLQPAAFYEVQGTIAGLPPGATANLEFISSNLGGPRPGFPNFENGSFKQVVSAGRYMLRATAQTTKGIFATSVPLEVTSNMTGVRLTLAPAATIPIKVDLELTQNSNPQLQARVPVGVQFVSGDFEGSYYPPGMRMAWLDERLMEAQDVKPGVYPLRITPDGPWYVAAARRGSTDLLSQALVVDSAGEGEPIEITLHDDFASIRGTVSSDGQPASGVVLLISERAQEPAITIPVDSGGHFQLDAAPPGEYTAFAFDRIAGLEYRNPEAMQPYAGGSQPVLLPSAGEASVNLQLQKRQEY